MRQPVSAARRTAEKERFIVPKRPCLGSCVNPACRLAGHVGMFPEWFPWIESDGRGTARAGSWACCATGASFSLHGSRATLSGTVTAPSLVEQSMSPPQAVAAARGSDRVRLDYSDGLRGIAACYVTGSHLYA